MRKDVEVNARIDVTPANPMFRFECPAAPRIAPGNAVDTPAPDWHF